jgi:threonine/homoserine/homoserine lactone efflux protein
MTFVVFGIYAIVAGTARRAIVESPRALRVMRRLFAASFTALGFRLAFEND